MMTTKEMKNEYAVVLTMDELEGVCGGANEEDNAIVESVLVAVLTLVAKVIIQTILPDTFEEFYKIIKDHSTAVQAGITGALGIPGLIAYKALSADTKKKLWSKVYDALK